MPPAARVGDLTVHGGTIVAGAATVLIDGMPAARQGDMHVCPMCNPGTPPPPHVGGPVAMGSTTVMIENMPAARMGDMCICSGPPDTIAMGSPNVIINDGGNPVQIGGSGMTMIGGGGGMVVIGGGTASGGGGGGGQGIGAKAAKYSAAAAQSLTPEATELREPFLAAQIANGNTAPIAKMRRHLKDADGKEDRKALPGNGQVLNGRLESDGDSEITVQQVHSAQWSASKARVEEEVQITAAAPGIPDGTTALICIQQLSRQGGGTDTVEVLPVEVTGEQIEATWAYGTSYGQTDAPEEVDTERPVSDQMPIYVAEITLPEVGIRRTTGTLSFEDTMRVDVVDETTGEPLPNVTYTARGATQRRDGQANDSGHVDEQDIPPGRIDLHISEADRDDARSR